MTTKRISKRNNCHAWLCSDDIERRQIYLWNYDQEYIKSMYILFEPTRFRLALLLKEVEKLCVCDLANILSISVPAVSQHLSKLYQAGRVTKKKEKNTIYYQMKKDQLIEYLIK